MIQSNIILLIIRLVLGGITAFLAIMLWSKTHDAVWMSLVAGVVTSYASTLYDMMIALGVIASGKFEIAGVPIVSIIFTVIPSCFFIVAFILMIKRTR